MGVAKICLPDEAGFYGTADAAHNTEQGTFPMTAWAVVRLVWPSGSRSAAGGLIVGSSDAIRA